MRRTLFQLLGLALALLAAVALAASLYWHHLVRTYTSAQPLPVPAVRNPAATFPELKERWDAWALHFLNPDQPTPSFELSAPDLNAFVARSAPFGSNALIELEPNRFRVRFTTPLDATRRASLRGRHLNGVVTVTPRLADGRLHLNLETFEANGRPIPGWALRRLRRLDLAERLTRNADFALALGSLERIEVTADHVLLLPRAPAVSR